MDPGFHLERLAASADSISTLYFRPPGTFANAMLKSPDITTLIRDAEDSEAVLFTLAQTDVVAKVAAATEMVNLAKNSTESSHHSNRSQNNTQGKPDDVELLCNAIETIAQSYPMAGIADVLKKYRERHRVLHQNISEYQTLVETQRKQIDVLSKVLESFTAERHTSPVSKRLKTTKSTTRRLKDGEEEDKEEEEEEPTIEQVQAQMDQLRKEIETLKAEAQQR